MDFDDDAPPELVDTTANDVDEEITVKVPITIVTGITICTYESTILIFDRLSRGWQNNTAQLHPHCPTWQKDRRYHEWLEITTLRQMATNSIDRIWGL